jgi:hypothetical protein
MVLQVHSVVAGRGFLAAVDPPTVQSGALHRAVELRLARHLERHQHHAAAVRGDARPGAHVGRRDPQGIRLQNQTDRERAEDPANVRPEPHRKRNFCQFKVSFPKSGH